MEKWISCLFQLVSIPEQDTLSWILGADALVCTALWESFRTPCEENCRLKQRLRFIASLWRTHVLLCVLKEGAQIYRKGCSMQRTGIDLRSTRPRALRHDVFEEKYLGRTVVQPHISHTSCCDSRTTEHVMTSFIPKIKHSIKRSGCQLPT
ncbi:hypothetical protein AGIG_G14805 [Arapaima gigas]